MTATSSNDKNVIHLDCLVVGAGFGGMYAVHRLRSMGLSLHAIEAGGGVGGTWYWNRYPGARCDVMSIDYSYSFSDEIMQEWTWSEVFAQQPEILAYANFVAKKLDLLRSYSFNTRAVKIHFDDVQEVWSIQTDSGCVYRVKYLVMATGPLSMPKPLDIPGVDAFQGQLFQAQKWPHTPVDFAGKRVGLIGVGSSGIQIAPVVAEQCEHLTVFQRTPSFTLPARTHPLTPEFVSQIKANYPHLRRMARTTFTGGVRAVSTRPFYSVLPEERKKLMSEAWDDGALTFIGLFSDLLFHPEANEEVAEFVRSKIDEVVKDPATAEKLKPRGYPIFARRPCLDTNYYETFNRDNVRLVDCVADPIEEITATGIRTSSEEIKLDIIIAANGYDALTGAMLAIDVTGKGGASLKKHWAAGARSYLGLMMAGFPNLFIVAGANGPSALANFVVLNEQNVDWAAKCIDHLRNSGLSTLEPTPEAEERWMDEIHSLANSSLYPRANTWYTGANVAGKPRGIPFYLGGLKRYIEECNGAIEDFRHFKFSRLNASASTSPESTVAVMAEES
ncbi:NAD(P)/FAD-dependent oxidoreductase [Cupriavidus taiwanensis]|uniref:flavin-containing monooxygenase n=1 Tax=Cupriavidus taiwanensis TaxID=164546 RepID=UPI000E190B0F|nr:NAD(P)/FAD-dependent oxidoreductase [Cupriavidus taiwanensis]SOZ29610.1 Phenylacetone monooxygenase [Cupriavidus taiwanensis]SPA34445.1 Phenylacetone monooxygenase [Cupriavidus taiwanensis]